MTSPLLTDLYQLTMAQAYLDSGVNEPATFSLFIRGYPENRAYFVSAGLADVLSFLEGFSFSDDDLGYLASTGTFSPSFLEGLARLRFTGSVRAIPEGRLFFVDEPVMEVTAPVVEAQLVETFIINQVNLQTLLATKASRVVHAARGRGVVDFGLRRTHGTDAGMQAARWGNAVGFQATSNVLAGKEYGIPVTGTMAHSFVTSFEDETESFRAFVRVFPRRSTLLIDTYDTLEGARRAAVVGREMQARGEALQGVRLDSGDLATLSRAVRVVLDGAGLPDVRIFASGGLDEFDIDSLVSQGAPIDAFGVGTKVGTSSDAPWTDMVYKLVRFGDRPVLKLSAGKRTLPAEKQVFRFRDGGGRLSHDVIAVRDERGAGGEPLLEPVMERGTRLAPREGLDAVRRRFESEFTALPERFKALQAPPAFPVRPSERLAALTEALTSRRGGSQ